MLSGILKLSSGKGELKPGIYGRSCSEGHFQMCHSALFTGKEGKNSALSFS